MAEYSDRVARDSSMLRFVERTCHSNNTSLVVINPNTADVNSTQEMMTELVAYCVHLSSVAMGKRAGLRRKIDISEPAMKRAFLLRTSLVSFRVISDILEKEGYVDKNGKPYKYNVLANRLSNPTTWASLMALYKGEVKPGNSFEVFAGECVRHAVSKESIVKRHTLCKEYEIWLDKQNQEKDMYPVSYTTISRVMKKLGFSYSTVGKQRKIITYEGISLTTKKRGKGKTGKI